MSRIRGKNTNPKMIVRQFQFHITELLIRPGFVLTWRPAFLTFSVMSTPKLNTAFLIFGIVCFLCARAASQAPNPTEQLEAISKLDWLIGNWKGEGWIEFAPGERRTLTQTEIVQRKAGGTVATVEGHGMAKNAGTNVTALDAFTVVSYDPRKKKYRWHSHTDRGHFTDVELTVGQRTFQWAVEAGNFGTMRYTMVLNDKGEWFEIGEVSRDGQPWRKFFEMTLAK